MRFERAMERLRRGSRMTRADWPEGQWVVKQDGYPEGIPINENTARATGLPQGTNCTFSPYLMVHWGDRVFVPYLPDQWDLFAEDWETCDSHDRAEPVATPPTDSAELADNELPL